MALWSTEIASNELSEATQSSDCYLYEINGEPLSRVEAVRLPIDLDSVAGSTSKIIHGVLSEDYSSVSVACTYPGVVVNPTIYPVQKKWMCLLSGLPYNKEISASVTSTDMYGLSTAPVAIVIYELPYLLASTNTNRIFLDTTFAFTALIESEFITDGTFSFICSPALYNNYVVVNNGNGTHTISATVYAIPPDQELRIILLGTLYDITYEKKEVFYRSTIMPEITMDETIGAINAANYTLTGIATPGSTITLHKNNVAPVTVTTKPREGLWYYICSLEEGQNMITALATSPSGVISAPVTRYIERNSDLPPLEITIPTLYCGPGHIVFSGKTVASSDMVVSVDYGELQPVKQTLVNDTFTYDYTISGADAVSEVTIAAKTGVKLYYTIDGTTPTTNSNVYIEPFVITRDTLVKAIAVSAIGVQSPTVTTLYRVDAVAPAIASSPVEGTYHHPILMQLSTNESADIMYDTNETIVTTWVSGDTPVPIWEPTDVHIRATDVSGNITETTKHYNILNSYYDRHVPTQGVYYGGILVLLNVPDGGEVRYEVGNGDATLLSPLYTGYVYLPGEEAQTTKILSYIVTVGVDTLGPYQLTYVLQPGEMDISTYIVDGFVKGNHLSGHISRNAEYNAQFQATWNASPDAYPVWTNIWWNTPVINKWIIHYNYPYGGQEVLSSEWFDIVYPTDPTLVGIYYEQATQYTCKKENISIRENTAEGTTNIFTTPIERYFITEILPVTYSGAIKLKIEHIYTLTSSDFTNLLISVRINGSGQWKPIMEYPQGSTTDVSKIEYINLAYLYDNEVINSIEVKCSVSKIKTGSTGTLLWAIRSIEVYSVAPLSVVGSNILDTMPRDASLSVTMSEQVNFNTVNDETIFLVDSEGIVPVIWGYDFSNHTITVTPTQVLDAEKYYALVVTRYLYGDAKYTRINEAFYRVFKTEAMDRIPPSLTRVLVNNANDESTLVQVDNNLLQLSVDATDNVGVASFRVGYRKNYPEGVPITWDDWKPYE